MTKVVNGRDKNVTKVDKGPHASTRGSHATLITSNLVDFVLLGIVTKRSEGPHCLYAYLAILCLFRFQTVLILSVFFFTGLYDF